MISEAYPDPELQALAETAARRAYAPYSGFHVGAALRSAQGQVYAGCNVESAAYPVGGCAERAALAAAVLAEGAALRLEAMVIVATDPNGAALPVSPCGACRQALAEFTEHAPLTFLAASGHWAHVNLAELLPYGFNLPKHRAAQGT